MKKILLASLVLSSSSVFAHDIDFTGFYLGANIGVSNLGFKKENKEDKIDKSITSPTFGLLFPIGYGFRFGDNLIGNVEISATSVISIGTKESGNGIGLGVAYLQGYAIDNFMPYFRVGISYLIASKLVLSDDNTSFKASSAPGIDVGVGFRYAFNDDWRVGLEYSHKNYFGNKEKGISGAYINTANINVTYQW